MPRDSFFLFGPRGTGKSTLLRHWLPDACWFDLLDQAELVQILRSPGYFAQSVLARPKGSWVVVDEVQKAPQILDEVHRLIESHGYRFALSGSSARKLNRGAANLLAGRALIYHLFPLTFAEYANWSRFPAALEYGCLPRVLLDDDAAMRGERLRAYVNTYLAEEVRAEALTRNIAGFSRFLTIAAIANGQVTNLSNIARDAGVARATVGAYFSILEETLIGAMLPAWLPRLRIKEVEHPKFYLFDCGVFRALIDRVGIPPSSEERGVLLETMILHELRAAMEYRRTGGQLCYWRTHDGVEVDFVWSRGARVVAIKVKGADTWKSQFADGLAAIQKAKGKQVRCFGVYTGRRRLQHGEITVLPVRQFLAELDAGRVI